MKKFRLIIVCLLSFLGTHSQSLSLFKTINLPKGVNDIELDQFGNIYLVLGSELRKLTPVGEFEASFADPNFGDIDHIDLLNPMAPLIYYADFNQLRILDNRLNQSQSLSLLNLGFNDPKLIAYSDQNRFWVYDQSADRLVQFSLAENRIVNQGPIIRQLEIPKGIVSALFSGFNNSLIYLQGQGFVSFDALGAKKEFIPEQDSLQSFDFDNRRWLSLNEQGLIKVYPINNSKKPKTYLSPISKVNKLILRDLNLYFWVDDKLYQYRFD